MAVVEITITGKDETGGIFDSVGSAIGGLATAAVAAAAALTALATAGLIASVNAAIQSEEAVARLEGILRATSDAAGVTSQELQDLANNLQLTTRYSDETILAGTSLLLTFRNIGEETLPRTIEAMLDMAEIFGSVDSSAMQLGKALNEPLTMLGSLTRAGVTFSEEQKEMIKGFVEMGDMASAQNIILSEEEAQVGGLAEVMGNTFAGQIEILKNRFDEIKETIGTALIPVLETLMNRFVEFLPTLEAWGLEFAQFLNSDQMAAFTENVISMIDSLASIFNSPESFFTWFDAIDWQQVSDKVADGLNSVDWSALGGQLRGLSDMFAVALSEALNNVDWGQVFGALGRSFADFWVGFFGGSD